MRFHTLVLSICSITSAFKITNGSLKSDKKELDFFEVESLQLNSTSETVSVSFNIESETKPNQIFVKLTNENGVESSFKPSTKKSGSGYINKLTIPFTKLPSLFQASSQLTASLIVASPEHQYFETIGQIENTPYLRSTSNYEPAEKLEAKPEIHHIFQQPPKTVDPAIAVLFSALSFLGFFALIVAWAFNGALNFYNFKVEPTHLAFVASVVGYEVIFFLYYLGDSIFVTIARVAILTGPAVWFGSRLLNYLGELRIAGQR